MTYGDLWWRLIFVGAGMGLTYPLFPIVGLRALPDEHAGQGSGVINMCFYMGLSVALAAGGTVLGKIRQEAVATTIDGLSDAPANALQWVRDLAHQKDRLSRNGPPDRHPGALRLRLERCA